MPSKNLNIRNFPYKARGQTEKLSLVIMEDPDKNSFIGYVNMEIVITSNVHKVPKKHISISNACVGEHEAIVLNAMVIVYAYDIK